MDLQLKGKRALITGASQGIGRATAELLAKEGCDLVLVSRTKADLEAVAESLGGNVAIHAADLSETGAPERLADAFPDIDILVNNAGAVPAGGIDDLSDAELRVAFDLKLFGYIGMCRSYYPRMRSRGRGVIVNVVGIGGQIRDPRYLYGAAANAGLTAFSQALGSESHRDGIRVVVINPGPVSTERLIALDRASRDASGRSSLFDNLPFGRAATPEEIATAIAFVASDVSAYVSGAVLAVDGGRSARASNP